MINKFINDFCSQYKNNIKINFELLYAFWTYLCNFYNKIFHHAWFHQFVNLRFEPPTVIMYVSIYKRSVGKLKVSKKV